MNFIDRLFEWIDLNLPSQCPSCQKWKIRKTFKVAHHRVAGPVEICSTCFYAFYPDKRST